jgi:MFS family permease
MTGRGIPVTETVLLAVWIGAALLFALVVAPAAFAVLPTRTLAGALVGRVLPAIFYAGVVIGSVIVILDVIGRSGSWGRTAAGAVSALACAVAQLVVGTRIDRLRAAIGGPLDALALDDPRRIAFGKLHAISVGWLGVAVVAAVVALALAVRSLPARQ